MVALPVKERLLVYDSRIFRRTTGQIGSLPISKVLKELILLV